MLAAVEAILKSLEALGFVVTARRGGDGGGTGLNVFRIERWGLAMDYSINAFLNLSQAYTRLAPELSAVARDYAKVAYTMVVGEARRFRACSRS